MHFKAKSNDFPQSTLTSTSLKFFPACVPPSQKFNFVKLKMRMCKKLMNRDKAFSCSCLLEWAHFHAEDATAFSQKQRNTINFNYFSCPVFFSRILLRFHRKFFLFHNFHSTLFALFLEKLLFQRPRMKVRQRNWSDGCLGDDISKEGSGRNLKASYRVFAWAFQAFRFMKRQKLPASGNR